MQGKRAPSHRTRPRNRAAVRLQLSNRSRVRPSTISSRGHWRRDPLNEKRICHSLFKGTFLIIRCHDAVTGPRPKGTDAIIGTVAIMFQKSTLAPIPISPRVRAHHRPVETMIHRLSRSSRARFAHKQPQETKTTHLSPAVGIPSDTPAAGRDPMDPATHDKPEGDMVGINNPKLARDVGHQLRHDRCAEGA